MIIGGLPLVIQGSSRTTNDIAMCYSRDRENLRRLARALAPFHPTLRGFPPELPFFWDDQTLWSGLNFTLSTDIGAIDLLGEVPGVGSFDDVVKGSEEIQLYGSAVRILGLDALERAKRAAGRAKDLLDLGEIAAIRSRRSP
ncbi:hypothetical protein ACSRUE_11160 [Sorangium sp. KYC3313]|uniref:hypothetical protein n=1 Tax=Sorangium sp. KYC3313 TaxID=3449740 RepID=UPI003F8CE008